MAGSFADASDLCVQLAAPHTQPALALLWGSSRFPLAEVRLEGSGVPSNRTCSELERQLLLTVPAPGQLLYWGWEALVQRHFQG